MLPNREQPDKRCETVIPTLSEAEGEESLIRSIAKVSGMSNRYAGEGRQPLHDGRLISTALIAAVDRLVREGKVAIGRYPRQPECHHRCKLY